MHCKSLWIIASAKFINVIMLFIIFTPRVHTGTFSKKRYRSNFCTFFFFFFWECIKDTFYRKWEKHRRAWMRSMSFVLCAYPLLLDPVKTLWLFWPKLYLYGSLLPYYVLQRGQTCFSGAQWQQQTARGTVWGEGWHLDPSSIWSVHTVLLSSIAYCVIYDNRSLLE